MQIRTTNTHHNVMIVYCYNWQDITQKKFADMLRSVEQLLFISIFGFFIIIPILTRQIGIKYTTNYACLNNPLSWGVPPKVSLCSFFIQNFMYCYEIINLNFIFHRRLVHAF